MDRLQPRLRRRGVAFPIRDVDFVLEREPDIVEAFEKPRAVGTWNIECDIGPARPADTLGHQIYRERRRAISSCWPNPGP